MRALAVSAALVWLSGCPIAVVPDDLGGPDGGERDVSPSADVPGGLDVPIAADAPAIDDAGGSRIDAVVALLERTPPDATALDAILYDVAWSEGWPLREGTRWLFVTELEDEPSEVHFVSALNAWSTTAHPARRAPTNRHYWVVLSESEFLVSPDGAQYKWLVGPSDYRPPLEATAYGFDGFGRFGWVRPDPGLQHLEQFPLLRSAHLGEVRTLRAHLPAGFVARSAAAARARTVLFHDGQNVFHPDAAWGGWRGGDTLGDARFSDVVALAIDNAADRFDAYTHVPDELSATSTVGGRADDYLSLIEDEALPFFRARYGVPAEGDSLMMIGSSLGGLVTTYAALTRPTLFGCGAAMSPTLGWGSRRAGLRDALVNRWPAVGHGPVSLYLDSGGDVTGACVDLDADGVADDADDSDNYCVTAQLRDVLDGLGYDFGVDLTHWHEPSAPHNEAAWAAGLGRALDACTAMGWTSP